MVFMMRIWMLVVLLVFLSGCQAVDPQPVFGPSAVATFTPVPLPAGGPELVASLAGVIWSFDISPDGSLLAIATSRGLEIYDLKRFVLLESLESGVSQYDVSWSPDGKRLAAGLGLALTAPTENAGGEAVLRVWDVSTWKVDLQTNFAGDMINERILDLAWKPDGSALALGTDMHGVMIVDSVSGKLLLR